MITNYFSFSESRCSFILKDPGFFGGTEIKPTAKPITECLADIEAWEAHRSDLQSQLSELNTFFRRLNRTAATTPVLSPSY